MITGERHEAHREHLAHGRATVFLLGHKQQLLHRIGRPYREHQPRPWFQLTDQRRWKRFTIRSIGWDMA